MPWDLHYTLVSPQYSMWARNWLPLPWSKMIHGCPAVREGLSPQPGYSRLLQGGRSEAGPRRPCRSRAAPSSPGGSQRHLRGTAVAAGASVGSRGSEGPTG